MTKNLAIRNSTAEFLIFTAQAGEESIEVKYVDETVWLSQKMMAKLFEVDIRTINEHLQNIFNSHELDSNSVIRKFRNTASDGKSYEIQFYNLDAIISVGYRVNSQYSINNFFSKNPLVTRNETVTNCNALKKLAPQEDISNCKKE